jgi:hypothetical protein
MTGILTRNLQLTFSLGELIILFLFNLVVFVPHDVAQNQNGQDTGNSSEGTTSASTFGCGSDDEAAVDGEDNAIVNAEEEDRVIWIPKNPLLPRNRKRNLLVDADVVPSELLPVSWPFWFWATSCGTKTTRLKRKRMMSSPRLKVSCKFLVKIPVI